MAPSTQPGVLFVLSGPSGAGKSTVVADVLARHAGKLRLAVSATTRPPRHGERTGVNYYFLSPDEFERRRQAGEFLECCEVFGRGHLYGTLESEVTPSLAAGQSVLLEIDVEGAARVVERFPDAVTIFLRPPSLDELERRLRDRKTESEEAIARRLDVARREMAAAGTYRHQVINDDRRRAADEISRIVTEQLSESTRR